MTPAAAQRMMKMPLPASNRSLAVAAPIDSTATPSRAATGCPLGRGRLPGERLFSSSRKAPPCASEPSSDVLPLHCLQLQKSNPFSSHNLPHSYFRLHPRPVLSLKSEGPNDQTHLRQATSRQPSQRRHIG